MKKIPKKMTMYIKNRKIDGVHQRAMTIFDENRKILFSDEGRIINQDMEKFEKTLIAIKVALRQFKGLTNNAILPHDIPLDIYISSKIIFDWLDKGNCPQKYLKHFYDIKLDLSFLTNPTEIHYKKLQNKAKYKSTVDNEFEKVTDFFEELIEKE